MKKISNATDYFSAAAWLHPHLAQAKSQPTVTWHLQTLPSYKTAAWQFWLQMIWAEPSQETHLTPDKSMTQLLTPTHYQDKVRLLTGTESKHEHAPPKLHCPHCPGLSTVFTLQRSLGLAQFKTGNGGNTHHTVKSLLTVKFQTQEYSLLIVISMTEIPGQQHSRAVWFLEVCPDTKLCV